MVGSGIGTSNPVAHLDFHRSLGEVLATESEGITVVECTEKVAINGPLDVSRSPIDSICVPCFDWSRDVVVDSTVVGRGVSLSEKVALDRSIRRTQPLPINLIQVIRFEDEAGDYTSARGSPDDRINFSEEDVFVAGDGGRVGGLVDCELSTVRSV